MAEQTGCESEQLLQIRNDFSRYGHGLHHGDGVSTGVFGERNALALRASVEARQKSQFNQDRYTFMTTIDEKWTSLTTRRLGEGYFRHAFRSYFAPVLLIVSLCKSVHWSAFKCKPENRNKLRDDS